MCLVCIQEYKHTHTHHNDCTSTTGADLLAAEGVKGPKLGVVTYPEMSKTLVKDGSRFTLHVEVRSSMVCFAEIES